MANPKIYFRDFLSKFAEDGGDITKITFRSSRLMFDYNVCGMDGRYLVCERLGGNPGKRTEFGWTPGIAASVLYLSYVVESIQSQKLRIRGVQKNRITVVLERDDR